MLFRSAYWQREVAALSTDATTRAIADQLLHPSSGPFWLRPVMPVARLLTIGLLEPAERALFALPFPRTHQRRFERVVRLTRLIYPRLPRQLRQAPMRHYLRTGRSAAAGPSAGPSAGRGRQGVAV